LRNRETRPLRLAAQTGLGRARQLCECIHFICNQLGLDQRNPMPGLYGAGGGVFGFLLKQWRCRGGGANVRICSLERQTPKEFARMSIATVRNEMSEQTLLA